MPITLGPAWRQSSSGGEGAYMWMVEPRTHGGRTLSFGELDGGSWSQQIYIDLFFKMVPSVPNDSVRIIGTYFRTKIETLQVDPSQMEPYIEVTIRIHNRDKKCFPTVYSVFCKKSHFLR